VPKERIGTVERLGGMFLAFHRVQHPKRHLR
jgi:hypothetical protein